MSTGWEVRRGDNPIARFIHLLSAGQRSPLQSQQLKAVTGYPLTLKDEVVLRLISADRPLSISEVAHALDVNPPRASRQLAKLEKLGLAQRLPCREDARSSRLRATPEGELVQLAWRRLWVRDYVAAVAPWDPADIAGFGDILTRLHNAFGTAPVRHHRLDRLAVDLAPWAGDPPRSAALEYTVPALLGFVHWAATSVIGPANTRHVLEAAASPVAAQPVAALRVVLRRGPLDITDLGEHTGLMPSRISRIVADLEKHGFVERAPDSLDGRRTRLKGTARGAALIRRVNERELEPINAAMTGWDPADIHRCMSYFENMLGNFAAVPVTRSAAVRRAATRTRTG
ncbi:MarR family transcriptional regulator [Nocardia sp. NPDC050193]